MFVTSDLAIKVFDRVDFDVFCCSADVFILHQALLRLAIAEQLFSLAF